MSISREMIEQLLHEEEGTTLDFKQDQYAFDGADDRAKSELLKDILALANAFRRSDSYILIGVEEVRGGRSNVVGVSSHLDDANLQQFVNSKTQRPVTFSYRQASHDGLSIGIIHIPLQSRPVYSKVDYGKVKKQDVYLRRGSSTAVARPDEVSEMGSNAENLLEAPSIELRLVDRKTGDILGNRATIPKCTWYEIVPRDIPDYSPNSVLRSTQADALAVEFYRNVNYFREVAEYIQTRVCFPVTLEVRNTSSIVIKDLEVSMNFRDAEGQFLLLSSEDCSPEPNKSFLNQLMDQQPSFTSDIEVVKEGDDWKITCSFGKVQPQAVARLQDDLLVGSRSEGEMEFSGRAFADNIRSPIPISFRLLFQDASKSLSVDQLCRLGNSSVYPVDLIPRLEGEWP